MRVIDSRTASIPLGLTAIAAADASRLGADLEDVERAVSRAHPDLLATLDTLEYLQKGGRIGAAQAFFGGLLNVKPLITFTDGVVAAAGRVRTRRKALAALLDWISAQEAMTRLESSTAMPPTSTTSCIRCASGLPILSRSWPWPVPSSAPMPDPEWSASPSAAPDVAANLPARYQLEIRLGRDQDVEEWLATDLTLDRPILVRLLGPEVGRTAVVDSWPRSDHWLPEPTPTCWRSTPPAPMVSTRGWWPNGRVGSRSPIGSRRARPMPVAEFLPNAAGLADALSELHALDVVHGDIGPHAVSFAAAHPAKLMAFSHPGPEGSRSTDVADLARTLETALNGSDSGGLAPSQLTDAIHRSVDEALGDAKAGRLTAAELAARLKAAPTVRWPGAAPAGRGAGSYPPSCSGWRPWSSPSSGPSGNPRRLRPSPSPSRQRRRFLQPRPQPPPCPTSG